jgi:hypothetical protein
MAIEKRCVELNVPKRAMRPLSAYGRSEPLAQPGVIYATAAHSILLVWRGEMNEFPVKLLKPRQRAEPEYECYSCGLYFPNSRIKRLGHFDQGEWVDAEVCENCEPEYLREGWS